MPKHIHSDLIKAWADGAEIQYFDDINPYREEWKDIVNPLWDKYGIRPNLFTSFTNCSTEFSWYC